MLRLLVALILLTLVGCMPATPPQQLPEDCLAVASVQKLITGNWLNQPAVWRLRQATLLEVGNKKIPLEGFLRLDLVKQEARLVAMNGVGLVLFDLLVTAESEELKRAVPQLLKVDGFAAGVAQSLRQIFFLDSPTAADTVVNLSNIQRVERSLAGGEIEFIYDCQGDLRTIRQDATAGDWRVAYDNYQLQEQTLVPEQIVMNDYRHRLKLSLWIRGARQE